MNLTAEQLAPLETRIAFHRELAALHRREVSHHETKVAQLEQMHADLGNGQLTSRQIERYPVVSGGRA